MVELNTISMKRNETFNISYQYPKAHHAMENGSAGFHHYRHASNRFHNGRNQVSDLIAPDCLCHLSQSAYTEMLV